MKEILLLFTVIVFFSCGKDVTILPEESVLSEEEVQAQHADYLKKLVDNSEGWFLNIAGAEGIDSVMLHLVFRENGTVLIKSTKRENLNQVESSFSINGKYHSILNFTGNSIVSLLGRIDDSPQSYIINSFFNNVAFLKRADGYNNKLVSLVPYSSSRNSAFLAKQDSVYDLLDYESAFAVTKGLFLNMVYDNGTISTNKKRYNVFSYGDGGFHWSNVDTITKKITFEFVPVYNALNPTFTKYTSTHSFDYFPGGMVFSPAVSYGGAVIDTILFDDYDASNKVLNITKAGNLEDLGFSSASFGFANQEAHYYEGLLKLFDKTHFNTANVNLSYNVTLPVTTNYKGVYGELADVARSIINEGTAGTTFTSIFRVNSTGSGGGSQIQIFSNNGNAIFKLDYTFSGKNHLYVSNVGVSPSNTPPATTFTAPRVAAARQFIVDAFTGVEGYYIVPTRELVNGANVVLLQHPTDVNSELRLVLTTGSAIHTYYQRYMN